MNNQPRFDFSIPMSRSSDPVTSDIAEAQHIKSGKRKRNCDLILEAIKLRPFQTSAELAESTGLDRHEAARRCSDLRAAGMVENLSHAFGIFKRKCRVTNSLCIVWRIV